MLVGGRVDPILPADSASEGGRSEEEEEQDVEEENDIVEEEEDEGEDEHEHSVNLDDVDSVDEDAVPRQKVEIDNKVCRCQ
jgi:rRNA-processing protein EBP2